MTSFLAQAGFRLSAHLPLLSKCWDFTPENTTPSLSLVSRPGGCLGCFLNFLHFTYKVVDGALAAGLAVALWWQPVLITATVFLSLFRFLSESFPGTEHTLWYMGQRLAWKPVCPWNVPGQSSLVCRLDSLSVPKNTAFRGSKQFPFSSPFFCLVGGRKAGCVGRNFVSLPLFTPL